MRARLKEWFDFLFSIDKHDRTKVFLLALSFCFIIGAYTLAKELKDSIFVMVVGKEYIWLAKLISIFVLVPSILLYSKLVDKLRRYHLLSFYCLMYGSIGLVFTYFLSHPTIGIANTDSSPARIFGWLFYLFIEGYSPFVVSVFWAFANSINDPGGAKKSYGLLVSGSKIGGMIASGSAVLLLQMKEASIISLSHTLKHQILLGVSSLFLLVVPFVLTVLMRVVSGRYLHGYEAAYQVEKSRSKKGESQTGIFSGLKMLLRYPYAMGIFFIALFYEVIQTVLSYQRLGIAQAGANVSQMSAFLFKMAFITHLLGFSIAFLGTRSLISRLGERFCLILVPASTAVLFLFFRFFATQQWAFITFFVVFRAIHYAFSSPLRESLYIPTVKEIKFKSKSWIDAFGTKFAKGVGSLFNGATSGFTNAMFLMSQSVFFSIIIALWLLVALLLGNRFEKAVQDDEVIGIDRV